MRLFEAKRLLLNTSLSVADVACRVGYPGVGTFTTRFTRLVGVSPGHYRRLPKSGMLSIADDVKRLPNVDVIKAARPRAFNSGAAIVGSVHFGASSQVSRLLVGAFDEPIPQGPPVRWELVPAEDIGRCWRLDGLPAGEWTVIAVAEGQSSILVGVHAPVRVSAGVTARVELDLHRPRRTDAPIMVPLRPPLPVLDQLVA